MNTRRVGVRVRVAAIKGTERIRMIEVEVEAKVVSVVRAKKGKITECINQIVATVSQPWEPRPTAANKRS